MTGNSALVVSPVTYDKRRLGKAVRVFKDQAEVAETWAASQVPPGRPEDILRWYVDLGIKAAEAQAKKKARSK